jgi:hypothetical protein
MNKEEKARESKRTREKARVNKSNPDCLLVPRRYFLLNR